MGGAATRGTHSKRVAGARPARTDGNGQHAIPATAGRRTKIGMLETYFEPLK